MIYDSRIQTLERRVAEVEGDTAAALENDLASTTSGKGADMVAGVMKVVRATDSTYGLSTAGTAAANATALQAAATAATGDILFIPAGAYTSNAVTLPSNIVIMGDGYGSTSLTQGTTGVTSLINATTQNNIEITGIKFIGTGTQGSREVLIDLTTCNNVHIHGAYFYNAVVGVDVSECIGVDIHNNIFHTMLRKTDGANGYGVVSNSTDVQVQNNRFDTCERHSVYLGSTNINCVVSGNVAVDCKGTPFAFNTSDGQTTSRNLLFIGNSVYNITAAGSGTDEIFGFGGTGNIDGLSIIGNLVYNNEVGGGIFVQHTSTAANPIQRVQISNNTIKGTAGGHGIQVLNGSDVVITGNILSDLDTVAGAYSGIVASASGTGVGSYITDVVIRDNIVDTGKYGINIAGIDATHKATGIVLGENILTNQTSRQFNMGTVAYVEYKVDFETARFAFTLDDAAASQTDTPLTAGHGGSCAFFVAPFDGYLYAMSVGVNETLSGSDISFEYTDTQTPTGDTVTLSAGELDNRSVFALHSQAVTEGDRIGVVYTTDGSWTDTTADFCVLVEIVRK